MPDSFVTIQMEGTDAGGDVRLNEFIEELIALKSALKVTERSVVPDDSSAIGYRITNLSHSSPASVTVGIWARKPAYKDAPRKISRRLSTGLSIVRRAHRYSENLDENTIDTFKALTAQKHIGRVILSGEGRPVNIDQVFKRNLERLILPPEMERDEISGRMERLDIHNKTEFYIFPAVGPVSIRCIAREELSEFILEHAGKWVSVEGWAVYRKNSRFPVQMKVEKIAPKNNPNAPRQPISALRDALKGEMRKESPEDLIRSLRNGSW